LQLNYASPGLQQAMRQELVRIAGRCDGVRCDMAMLILPAVFERTWGLRAPPFWPDAIARLRQRHPGFVFLAEAYWDLEWTLQQQGFDYTYDKTLYDRLRQGGAAGVRGHLSATLEYQGRSARFLENHDEPRAASVFPAEQHRAAAAIAYLAPGLRFVHDGQTEGRRVRASVHLRRRAEEPADGELRSFYGDLLRAAAAISGRSDWRLLECARAWPDNWTAENFVCLAWGGNSPEWLAVVNYAGCQGQCFVQFPFPALDGRGFRLSDRLSAAVYDRSGDELRARGLYLDLPPWGCHVFDVKPLPG
jgi:hypothetical protein